MRDTLLKLKKVVNVLYKLLPILIDLLEDFADDGKVNKSNRKSVTNVASRSARKPVSE